MFYLFYFMSIYFNRIKKTRWTKFCNIVFLFLLKIGSVGPVDQQINLASPEYHENLKNTYFEEHLLMVASDYWAIIPTIVIIIVSCKYMYIFDW